MIFKGKKISAKNINELVEHICNLYERHTGIRWRVLDNSDYSNRGIKLHKSWHGAKGRRRFVHWSLIHGFKPELVIDRINTHGDYSPKNCRWITKRQNCQNLSCGVMIKFKGKSINMSALADTKHCKVSKNLFRSRIHFGWPVELALTEPSNSGKGRFNRGKGCKKK
jgi:hypothetical protein